MASSIWAIVIGLFVGKAVVKRTGKVTWTARILVGLLISASVACGDSIFFALTAMKERAIAFAAALKLVLANSRQVETDAGSGITSVVLALSGAGIFLAALR